MIIALGVSAVFFTGVFTWFMSSSERRHAASSTLQKFNKANMSRFTDLEFKESSLTA
jgi:hypothetical protein